MGGMGRMGGKAELCGQRHVQAGAWTRAETTVIASYLPAEAAGWIEKNPTPTVIPAKAGIQKAHTAARAVTLDSRLRGNDGG